jgi:hypothetical protein
MKPALGSPFRGLGGSSSLWPDSPVPFLSPLRREGINVLENGSSRFCSLVGSSPGSVDVGQSSHALLSFAILTELKMSRLAEIGSDLTIPTLP